jgi:hypothetical protein
MASQFGVSTLYVTSNYSPEALARIREAEALDQAALDRASRPAGWLTSREPLTESPKEREAFRWKEIARQHAESQATEKGRAVQRLRELKADAEAMREEFGGNDPVTREAEQRFAAALEKLTTDDEAPGATAPLCPEDLL